MFLADFILHPSAQVLRRFLIFSTKTAQKNREKIGFRESKKVAFLIFFYGLSYFSGQNKNPGCAGKKKPAHTGPAHPNHTQSNMDKMGTPMTQ